MDHSQNIVTLVTVRASMQGAAGWVMWFLVGLSVFSLIIVVERWFFLLLNRCDVDLVQAALSKLMASGETTAARGLLERQRGLAAKVVLAGIEASPRGRAAATEIMDGTTKAMRVRYERGLAVLGTLGNNAPFIGLFGTVLEIIRSLHILAEKSGVGAGLVMSSLSEALAATAIGLLVALPAVAAHNYFQRRIRIHVSEAEALASVLLAHLSEGEQPTCARALDADTAAQPRPGALTQATPALARS